MSDDGLVQTPAVFTSKERAALVAKALSEAARRARFSTKKRKNLVTGGGYRAKRGAMLFRRLAIASFVLVVAIPTLFATLYFGLIASDQYTAEARFTVRGGTPPPMDAMGGMAIAPSALIIQDTQVIMNYLQSSAIVEALDKSVDLTAVYTRPDIDYLSRMKSKASIEKKLSYWKKHIKIEVQLPSGIVVFTVRAFTADDAVSVANAAIASSDQLVNRMNDAMISDATKIAQAERERAQVNLGETQAKLERVRNQEGVLSADASSAALLTLISSVKSQLLKMQEEYESQHQFVSEDAPQLRTLQTKIDAAKLEIDKLQAQMTSDKTETGSSKALAGSMSRLDYANLNNQIAGGIYAGAMMAVEQAHVASELKMMYINTFISPAPADQARYPSRGLDIALFLGGSLLAWGCVLGGLRLARGYLS